MTRKGTDYMGSARWRPMKPEVAEIGRKYDQIPHHIRLQDEFYDWMAGNVERAVPDKAGSLLDLGCGNGYLLQRLEKAGYARLAGVDISEKLLENAAKNAPSAKLRLHDITSSPYPETQDAIVCSEVIEHLTEPELACRHLYESLREGGTLVLSFPNRQAYFPWYYLNPVAKRMPQGRARHWSLWFTTPYEMRSTQPIDHAYSHRTVRKFLTGAGFRVRGTDGWHALPMMRISGIDWTKKATDGFERAMKPVIPKGSFYRFVFFATK